MKKHLLLSLLLVASMIVLCGCGGGTKKNQGNAASGMVVVGITNDMDSLDPHKAVAAGTKEALYNIFEGLVKADTDGVMQPAVCSKYEVADDALSITFTLRENVYFHNGDVVTADDVIYSIERAAGRLDGETDIKVVSAFSIISGISKQTADDGSTEIIVSLSEPNTELIYYFDSAIIPADYDKQETSPVGTGPFKFKSYTPMEKLCLVKNEEYYGEQAKVSEVTFKIFGSTDDAFMELMAGNVDIFPYLSFDQAQTLEGEFDIQVGMQSLAEGLYLNNEYGPLSDVRVRQALSYAVDFEELDKLLTGGQSEVLKTAMFPTFKEFYNKDTASSYAYNIEKAKELLKEAGYEDGFELEITIPNNYELHVIIGEVLVSQYAEIGVECEIKLVDWSTWLSDVYQGRNYQATVIALDATMAPGDVLDYYVSDFRSNFMNFKHEEYDELYNKALSSTDMDEKIAAYKEAQQYLTDNAAAVYLMCPSIMVAVDPALEGYTFYPVYVQDMSTVYWAE